MEQEQIINEVIRIIRKYLTDEYKILFFGSRVKGSALNVSDVDIGILGKKKAPWGLMAKILDKTGEVRTLRSIDVVDLNAMDDNFRNNILKYAKILN